MKHKTSLILGALLLLGSITGCLGYVGGGGVYYGGGPWIHDDVVIRGGGRGWYGGHGGYVHPGGFRR